MAIKTKDKKQNSNLGGSQPMQSELDLRLEQIRKKAYELYEKRGHQSGFDQEDWLEAERLIG